MKLVLIPGMDGTGRLFQWILPYLEPDISVLPLPSSENQQYAHLASDIMSQLPREDCILLLESFSSGLASILVESAQNVRGVIFVAGFLSAPYERVCRIAKHIPISKIVSVPPVSWIFRKVFAGGVDDRVFSVIVDTVDAVPSFLIKERLCSVIDLKLPDRQFEVPTLCLQGRYDFFSCEKKYHEITSVFKNTSRSLLPASHFVLQTLPKESAMRINIFVKRIIDDTLCHR